VAEQTVETHAAVIVKHEESIATLKASLAEAQALVDLCVDNVRADYVSVELQRAKFGALVTRK
jgi:type III secretory pathway lipoprotein EscJ